MQLDCALVATELLLAHRLGGDRLEHPVEHLLEKRPRPMRVGVRQRRARRRFDAQVGKFAFATFQSPFDLVQGMGSAQLAEPHADKLASARQPLASIFRPRFAGVNGCTHIVELLSAMACVAFQTVYPVLS